MSNWDVIVECISENWQLILLHNARLVTLQMLDAIENLEVAIREEKS